MRRAPLALIAGGAAAYAGASWLLSRSVAGILVSGEGLTPCAARREDLLSALSEAGASVHDFRFEGSFRDPVELAAVFATPGEPSGRPTVVFLHGKGGNAAEWAPDAARAISLGFNALVPDLRAHRPSGGAFVTFGFLEKEDLALAVAEAGRRFGLDRSRLGVHSCSAGSSVALEWAGREPGIRALWLESPFADPKRMARHYLSVATGLPAWLLGLTTEWAVRRAVGRIRRALDLPPGVGLDHLDPIAAAQAVRVPICLVFGARDRLVPPRFTHRLAEVLPPGSSVWNPRGAGHCHHDDEAERVEREEYVARWTAFFAGELAKGV